MRPGSASRVGGVDPLEPHDFERECEHWSREREQLAMQGRLLCLTAVGVGSSLLVLAETAGADPATFPVQSPTASAVASDSTEPRGGAHPKEASAAAVAIAAPTDPVEVPRDPAPVPTSQSSPPPPRKDPSPKNAEAEATGAGPGGTKPASRGASDVGSTTGETPPLLVVGADFVPYVGSSSSPRGRASARMVSFNLIGGLSAGLTGFELGSVFNLQTGVVRGAQIAGAFNLVEGNLSGAQIAGLLNYSGALEGGLELGGLANLATGDIEGAQIGGIGNLARGSARGLQFGGLLNFVTEDVVGSQIAGAMNYAKAGATGLELAGVANVVPGPLVGGQIAGAFNLGQAPVKGLQLAGVANVAVGGMKGAAVAPVNVATGQVHGVQIGVVNIAERTDFSLGVVNVNTRGRTHIEAWVQPESGIVAAGLKHGGSYWHSIYGAGVSGFDGGATLILGLGGHVPVADRWFIDTDALAEWLPTSDDSTSYSQIAHARAILGYRILPELAVFAGPSYNVLLREAGSDFDEPGYARRSGKSEEPEVQLWPGLVVGVQGLRE